jgi:hypothetical protein
VNAPKGEEKFFQPGYKEPKRSSSNPFLNVDGILCGGESNGCRAVGTCRDLKAITCGSDEGLYLFDKFVGKESAFYFVNSKTKQTINRCAFSHGKKDCAAGDLKEWTCDWPQPFPLKTQKNLLSEQECKVAPSDEEYKDIREKEDGSFVKNLQINIQGLACNKSSTGTILASCGDLIWIDPNPDTGRDIKTTFANLKTNKILEDSELVFEKPSVVGEELRISGKAVPKEWSCDWPPYKPDPPEDLWPDWGMVR